MNIARSLVKLHQQNVGKTFHRTFQFSAANYNSTQSTQPLVAEEKFDFEDVKVFERQERRKAAIPPFIKDVFVSVFNRELLAYPEIINKEESEALEKRLSAIRNVFSDSKYTLEDRKNVLKSTNMYGAPVPLTHNGLAINHTESLRYLDVITDVNLSKQLSDHWVGLEVLRHGLDANEYQQIIGDLITGGHNITLCLRESLPERLTQVDIRTTAAMDEQGIWRVSGEKLCHTSDGYLLVLCAADGQHLQLYLVHPGVTGVSYHDGKVTFRKSPATPLAHATELQLSRTLCQARLHSATIIRGVLKQIVYKCSNFVRRKNRGGVPLSEALTIRNALGEALTDIYASESADYFTAGLLDGYLEPDAELEMAMCRNFIAKHALARTNELLPIFCEENEELCDNLSQQIRTLTMYAENMDSVDVFIAMHGIQYAGKMMAQEIKNMRNPLFNPGFVLKKMFSNRNQENDNPPMDLHLSEHLHPTLRPQAENLEYCVQRMRYACEALMARHGHDIVEQHAELVRLAEAGTEILAMTAALGRASRSYCIGLRNAELEMKLASTFATKTREIVKKLINDIADGEYLNLDHYRINFGKRLLDTNSMEVENPTARSFW